MLRRTFMRRRTELTLKPSLNATARFALVALAGRSEAPVLPMELLRDAGSARPPDAFNPRVTGAA
jgi:hypothetical protein